jgi:hypothetical protein
MWSARVGTAQVNARNLELFSEKIHSFGFCRSFPYVKLRIYHKCDLSGLNDQKIKTAQIQFRKYTLKLQITTKSLYSVQSIKEQRWSFQIIYQQSSSFLK